MKHKKLIVLFLLPFFAFGQESKTLNLDTFLSRVKSGNIQIKKSAKEIEQAKADVLHSSSLFLPSITASHSGIVTTNPLMAFGSKLNQGILTQSDFNPSLLNNPVVTRNFATILRIEQPLINADGIFQRKAAKDALEAKKLQTLRQNDYIIVEAKKAYQQLQLTYKGLEVLQKAKELTANLQVQINNFFKEGLVQKSDVLAVDIRALEIENQLQTAQSNIINLSNFLSFLMNEEAVAIYKPGEEISTLENTVVGELKLSLERSDIRALEFATLSRKKMFQSEKLSYLPRLNAFGSYELYDNKVFQGDANGYIVGAQLQWDIFKGNKREAKIQKAKAAFEESKLNLDEYQLQSRLELTKTKQLFADSKRSLTLSKLTLEQSEEVLRIKTNRFKEGLEKISDVLMAETKVSEKRLEYYQAIYQHNTIYNYLEFLTKEN